MLLEKIKLEADEKVIIQARRHWFMIVTQVASLTLLALVPLLLIAFVSWTSSTYEQINITISDYSAYISFGYVLWLMFLWVGVFNLWTNYYLDVLTVTNRRVILVNQKGFFWRSVTSFRLERLQDISIEVNGFLATLLDYGDVLAETAGHAEEDFRATSMASPSHLKSLILQAADNRIPTTQSGTDAVS